MTNIIQKDIFVFYFNLRRYQTPLPTEVRQSFIGIGKCYSFIYRISLVANNNRDNMLSISTYAN